MPTSEMANSFDSATGKRGVGGDHVGDGVGDVVVHPPQSLLHRVVAGQVGLEDEPELAARGGDEVVERPDGRRDPFGVVVGRGERLGDDLDQPSQLRSSSARYRSSLEPKCW